MIIYSEKQNVYEAAKQRIHKLYDSGRHISIGFSGGKDSTVLLEITIEVMKERGISKVPVVFLDQEAEYSQTIEYMRYIMSRPEVEPYWIQCPFRLWNANAGEWFIPWEEGKEWMRKKENVSYKENVYGVDRFTKLLNAIPDYHFPENYIFLGGVRIEESPARRMGLLYGPEKFPGMRYGATRRHGTCIYPLFDWSYRDIWHYIFENKVKYNRVYNLLASLKPLVSCRVSSLIHENALQHILDLQKEDPELYENLYRRVKNVGTTKHLLGAIFREIRTFPSIFSSWDEYLNYLIDNIVSESYRLKFKKMLIGMENATQNWTDEMKDSLYLHIFYSICTEDIDFSKINNLVLSLAGNPKYRRRKQRKNQCNTEI